MSKINIRNWDSSKIIELADANPDGFTVDITTGEKVTKGYAVGLTHGLTPEDAAVIANLMIQGKWMPSSVYHWTIGGWRDGDKYVIDIGIVVRWEEAAVTFGKFYDQKAIYDLTEGKEIFLK